MDHHSERFLTAFEEVTAAALRRPGGRQREERSRAVWRAVEDGVLTRQDGETWDALAPLRNLIAHDRFGGQLPAAASPAAVAAIEEVRRKLCGTEATVWSLCGEVRTVTPDASVAEASRIMRQHDFSTLPVVSGEGIHGLLTANDVVWWVGGHLESLGLIEDAPVSDVMTAHPSVDYTLVDRRFLLRDVPPLFDDVGRNGCPVGAVLVTSTGHPHEQLSGIITPWDLASLTQTGRVPAEPVSLG